MRKDMSGFLQKIGDVIGEEQLIFDEELLETYREAGPVAGFTPAGVVKPFGVGQVREIIRLAREESANLIFSSSSPPRFRGDTVPEEEGVIVDMSGMDNIVRIDRRNKVALIEPGVTFPELSAAAEKQGLKVLMPLLPRQGKSVITSCLEREPIQIPKYHWDMTDPLLCTELVFGTGDVFRTGSAAGPGSLEQQWAAGGAQKNPMGPAQTDFARLVQGSQGTLAAVTWATVKLELKPTIHKMYFVPGDGLPELMEFTYRALRPKLGDEFFILNSYALATIIADDASQIESVASRQSPYTVVYGVSGYAHHPAKRVNYQEKDLSDIAAETGCRITREIPGCTADKMESILGDCSPAEYYKMQPEGDFLDIFFLTTMDRVPFFISKMEEVAEKFDYPPEQLGVYVQPIQHGRSVHLEFTLYYDGKDEEKAQQAEKLYKEASGTLAGVGAFFSRPYGDWADLSYSRCPDTVEVLRKIKKMLDPDGILNRGKLCFEEVK